jgi:hypothetical protein
MPGDSAPTVGQRNKSGPGAFDRGFLNASRYGPAIERGDSVPVGLGGYIPQSLMAVATVPDSGLNAEHRQRSRDQSKSASVIPSGCPAGHSTSSTR